MADAFISGVCLGICALLMLGIGLFQFKSRTPVGFYSHEKRPEASQLTDVRAWNRKHALMWILYGGWIALSWVFCLLCKDSLLILIPLTAGLLLPVPLMIARHHSLKRQYLENPEAAD